MRSFLALKYYPTTRTGGTLMKPMNITLNPEHIVCIREGERPNEVYLVTSTGVEYQIVTDDFDKLERIWMND